MIPTDARKLRDDPVPPTKWVFVAGRMWPLDKVDWYTTSSAGEVQSISLRPNLAAGDSPVAFKRRPPCRKFVDTAGEPKLEKR